jgi:PAS domain S-box-containing protein
MTTPKSFSRILQRCSFPAILALVLGLTATFIVSVWAYGVAQERDRITFERYANARVSAVKQRLFDVIGALQSINQSFQTFGIVSREQFRAYTQPLLARYPYVQAFDFHRLLTHAERPAFEAEMRKQFPNYTITDWVNGRMVAAGVRERYRVVDYIEPMAGNEIAFGFDAETSVKQSAAAQRARDTGLATVSKVLRLPQKNGAQRGFLILMPVYRTGALLTDVASRRRSIVGYTVAVLRADDFIQKSLAFADLMDASGNEISLFAGSTPASDNLVYRSGQAEVEQLGAHRVSTVLSLERTNRYFRTIDVAGTPWLMAVSARQRPFLQRQYGSMITLLLGTLFSILAAAYLQLLASRSRRIQQLVSERTAELQQANENLNRDVAARQCAEKSMQETEERLQKIINVMPVALFVKDSASRITLMNHECEQQWGLKFSEVQGTDAGKFFPPDQIVKFLQDDQAVFAGHKLMDYEELAWSSKLQKDRIMHTYKKPVFDENGNPSYLICMCVDITERKRAEDALRESQAQLRKLASHQNQIKEMERQRIAREIHDDLGQNLLVLRIDASLLHARTKGHLRLNEKVCAALNQIDVIMKSIRSIINDLRPSVLDLGLVAAMEWQANDFERRSGIECKLSFSGEGFELDDKRALELFRILQESLTNVLRHARATKVGISLIISGNQLSMRITDNGVGIFPECRRKKNAFGLLGIEERIHMLGGTFSMENIPDQGLSLVVIVPMEVDDGNAPAFQHDSMIEKVKYELLS